jgi:hypothetical protein
VRNPTGRPDLDLASAAQVVTMDAASVNRVLGVLPFQYHRTVHPRVIVQRSVIIAAQEVVEVDVEEAIAGNNEPAVQIRVVMPANDDIRRTPLGNPLL